MKVTKYKQCKGVGVGGLRTNRPQYKENKLLH